VADRHEPQERQPIRRDRSVITNPPLRWAVVVVFILAGVLILSKGFNGSGLASGGAGTGGGTGNGGTTHTTTPPPSHTPTHRPTTQTAPPLTGITVAIRNATNTSGLAGNERQKLQTASPPWDVVSIGNTSVHFTTTTIYYLAGALAQANYLKATYYPKAVVLPAVAQFNFAKIVLILGSDFAATP
jgi:LytR cell envelope-related transcriptional attenuator